MSFDFSFEKLVEYDSGRPGISIDVELSIGIANMVIPAKIDTGATQCVFARRCGEQLGIVIEDGEALAFRTATGSFLGFGHNVTLSATGYSFDSTVYFAVHDDFERNVLGRHGWLDRIVIGINDYEGKLYLSRYESE